jgi:hypothetical protein
LKRRSKKQANGEITRKRKEKKNKSKLKKAEENGSLDSLSLFSK